MIDIGTNLSNKAFRGDLEGVLARAKDAGVTAIVATGTSVPASRAVWEIAQASHANAPRLFATAGVHPHQASSFSADALVSLRELAARAEVVAIGECGLDFDRNFSPRDAQIACFEAQLDLAAELGMPVFLHERSAHEDFARILASRRAQLAGGVVHCFTGGRDAARRYLDLDLHVGVTGWINDERRGAALREAVRDVPDDRLMIETDAPYLLPRDMPRSARPPGGKNEPCALPYVCHAVAAARRQTVDHVARATTETARKFFGLP